MADMVRRNELVPTQFDPLRLMREWLHRDPFREMTPLPDLARAAFCPSFDVVETKDAYVFKADVPGVKPADLEVTIQGNRIQISGRRDQDHEPQDTIYARERHYGVFTRTFVLPDGVDFANATSELADGVLAIVVPKKPTAYTKHKIEVSTKKSKA